MRVKMNQEPLGVAQDIVLPANLRRWGDTTPSHYLTDYSAIGESPRHSESPFPYNPEVNSKVVLW